jgi:hypothetical protein
MVSREFAPHLSVSPEFPGGIYENPGSSTETSMPKCKVSKLDAARRQLETAINLYFYERDAVSIHTLTAAAHNIVTDIAKKAGQGDTWRETVQTMIQDLVPSDKRKTVRNKFREAENFFKHADRDPETFIEFNPGYSELLIWDCTISYRALTGEFPVFFQVFQLWFSFNNQHLFNFLDEQQAILVSGGRNLQGMTKQEFFEMALPIASRFKAP